LRVEAGARRFVMDAAQQVDAVFAVGMRFPAAGDIAASQSTASIGVLNELTAAGVRNRLVQRRLRAGRQRFVLLRAGVGRRRARADSRAAIRRRTASLAEWPGCRLGDHGRLGIGPALVLQLAFLQAALADHDAMRDADQFHVGEHDAGALVAVVEHDIDAGLLEVGVKLVGGSLDGLALVIAHRHDADFERGDGRRQMMPRSSLPCSMAAPTMRETPMP
jgi:hypothetical protein